VPARPGRLRLAQDGNQNQSGGIVDNLSGKVAFITGGASGIGFGIARAFLAAGIKVVIADASRENIEDATRQLQSVEGQYLLLSLDVTDRKAFADAADKAEAKFGNIHLLCNNAGIGSGPSILSATYEDWDRMIGINLYGVVNGVVTFLPRILKHGEGGYIVNTSSMAGILPLPDPGGIYSTTKFAVRGMTESLRLALAPKSVGAAVLCPGLTKTRILDHARDAMMKGKAATLSAGFVTAQQHALDPLIVGQAVLEGIRRNDAFILPHGEFVDEVRAMHDEIEAAFRTDLPCHPERAAFENVRRGMCDSMKALAAKL
jgi:NAD(P)-dependent dehydrogenase (short-subunit alcohol dehydrogenase family)